MIFSVTLTACVSGTTPRPDRPMPDSSTRPAFAAPTARTRVAAPAAAVLDLFVGQDGVATGAPPLAAPRPIGQPAPEQQQEEPLRPAVEHARQSKKQHKAIEPANGRERQHPRQR